MSDERGYDTKGSRKALGAMNAKLKAKIGRLERELAAYQRQVHAEHEGPDYGDGPEFEGWAERSAQQPQDVSAMAKVLSDRSADACNIDRGDNWAMYGQEYIDDVEAMLSVARLNGKED